MAKDVTFHRPIENCDKPESVLSSALTVNYDSPMTTPAR